MLKWLYSLFWKYRLRSIRDELQTRLSDRIRTFPIGHLTLECHTSSEPQTATVIRTSEDGTEEVHTVTITDTQWDGETQFPFWDNKLLRIGLFAKDDIPSDVQVAQIKSIMAYPQSIKSIVQSALLVYYRESVLPHNPTKEDGEALPSITKPSQLSKVLVSVDPRIALPEFDEEDTDSFFLEFGAWWSYHDVQVQIRNWEVVSVSE